MCTARARRLVLFSSSKSLRRCSPSFLVAFFRWLRDVVIGAHVEPRGGCGYVTVLKKQRGFLRG